MRLLNTQTLKLSEFVGDSIPPYIALSHTWVMNEEISLQDLQKIHEYEDQRLSPHPFTQKSGYDKISGCCAQAKDSGFDWVWIDTCCIDKTSSAELSEAINSMFQWYAACEMCYTFLSDVSDGDGLPDAGSEFRTSRWFTRGWTLQELIAPPNIYFFGKSWNPLGSRAQWNELLSQITGIPWAYLRGRELEHTETTRVGTSDRYLDSMTMLSQASVAQRMSWASLRSTTRKEDLAYCLLGIFGVNMPLLYGEGEKAFQRLQKEIIAQTNDHTILAWGYEVPEPRLNMAPRMRPLSYLATSPSEFAGCQHLVVHNDRRRRHSEAAQITKQGLQIEVHLLLRDDRFWALLDCHMEGDAFNVVGIPLSKPWRDGNNVLVVRHESPSRLWHARLFRWAQLRTVHISEFPRDKTRTKEIWLETEDIIIVPVLPFFRVELLNHDPTLAIKMQRGLDHFVISRSDSARELAPGRASFLFQPTITNTSFQNDLLVMIVIRSYDLPQIFDTAFTELFGRNPLPSNNFLEPSYPSGSNKLRRKSKYFFAAMARKSNEAWMKKIMAHHDMIDPWQHTYIKGCEVYCFIREKPDVSGDTLRSLNYLETLRWEQRIQDATGKQLSPTVQIEKLNTRKTGVLYLTNRLDDISANLHGIIELNLFFPVSLLSFRQVGRFLGISILAFVLSIGSSACIAGGYLFAGSMWMLLCMSCMALGLSQRRPNHELPTWLLMTSLCTFGLIAFEVSLTERVSVSAAAAVGLLLGLAAVAVVYVINFFNTEQSLRRRQT